MELSRAIMERRSIRQFEDRPVEKELLSQVLEAAIWAPTAGNIQPWIFVCVTETSRIRTVQTVSPGMLGNPQALICVCSDRKNAVEKAGEGGKILALFDCAMASQNIMLRAHDLGVGTCAIRSFNQAAVAEILDMPVHIQPELLIMAGYPAHQPQSPKRNKNVIYWEKYGRREDEK